MNAIEDRKEQGCSRPARDKDNEQGSIQDEK
jgi:hypothetical protein